MKNLFAILFCISFISLHAQSEVFTAEIKATSTAPDGLNGEFIVKDKTVAQLNPKDKKAVPLSFIYNKDRRYYDLKKIAGKKVAMKNRKPQVSPYAGESANAQSTQGGLKPNMVSLGQNKNYEENLASRIKTVTVTSETRKIDKFSCIKVIGKNKQYEVVAWIAKDIPLDYTDLVKQPSGLQLLAQMSNPYAGVKGLILEMTQKDLATGKTYKTNLQVEKKKINDKRFLLPEDYAVTDMTTVAKKQSLPSGKKMKSVTSRAFEVQNKVREQQKAGAAPKATPEAPTTKPTAPAKTAPKDQ